MKAKMSDRREFLERLAGTAGMGCLWAGGLKAGMIQVSAQQATVKRPKCAFVKFIQSLSPDEMANEIKRIGLDGIEATVRPRGQIEPDRIEEELPGLVEALGIKDLEITIMASHINRADIGSMEKAVRTAAANGVKRYRMAYYKYDKELSIRKTINECKAIVKDLSQLNKECGIQGLYQNHAGLGYVGAGIWDIVEVLQDISPEDIGIAFDVRHATVEGGKSWPVDWKHALPHIQAIYIKDFVWEGKSMKNVPLGEGNVDLKQFSKLVSSDLPVDLPLSLHVEYLGKAGTGKNLEAIQNDLKPVTQYF